MGRYIEMPRDEGFILLGNYFMVKTWPAQIPDLHKCYLLVPGSDSKPGFIMKFEAERAKFQA